MENIQYFIGGLIFGWFIKPMILIFAKVIKNTNKQYSLSVWEYGICNNVKARRHKIKRNVQFVLWEKGKQGFSEDYWHDFDSSWWSDFKIKNCA